MPSLTTHCPSKTRSKKCKNRNRSRKAQPTPSNTQPHNQPPNTNGYIPYHTYNNGSGNTPYTPTNTNSTTITKQAPSTLTPSTYSVTLTSNPQFLGHRSPFYSCLSRHCVMPICQKQLINFQFNLPSHYVSDIQIAQKKSKKTKKHSNHDNTTNYRLLHIRLFDLHHTKHVEWSEEFILKINGKQIPTPQIQKKKKKENKRKNKCKFVQPLNISKYAECAMSFEIECHKSTKFYGAASIEIVNLLTVDEIAARVIRRSELASSLQGLCDNKDTLRQQCKICGILDNLSRCSRCKATWYCSREHQKEDWNEHHLGCIEYEELNALRLQKRSPSNTENDDIICNEIKVSIRDPLSLCRISIPVRGIKCYHPQCVDLTTYLNYCHNTKVWQCPICIEPLVYTDLVVDESMKRIINEVGDDIDLVRLNPDDYSYKVITLKEQQESDGFNDSMSCSVDRKRRITDLSDDEEDQALMERKRRKIDDDEYNNSNNNNNNNNVSKRPIEVIVLD